MLSMKTTFFKPRGLAKGQTVFMRAATTLVNCATEANKKLEMLDIETRDLLSLVMRKPVFGISDQLTYKSGCRPTEDG